MLRVIYVIHINKNDERKKFAVYITFKLGIPLLKTWLRGTKTLKPKKQGHFQKEIQQKKKYMENILEDIYKF